MNSQSPKNSYRKPFKPAMDKGWWHKKKFYLFYLLRESTAFLMLWVSVELMFGVICTYTNQYGQDEFYRFIFFLQNPFVVFINILALISALYHTFTWFCLAPKAMSKSKLTYKIHPVISILIFWLITIILSVGILLLVTGHFR
ncbi:hypothetical protein RCS94_08370 [Orbaceae bacterium ac157xtp]